MKYPNENDSYSTWLKHCCKVFMTTWKRVDCAKDALDKIVAGIKELFSGAVEILFYLLGPVLVVFAPLVAYYGRKSYIKSHKRIEELNNNTIQSYRSNCSVKD